MLRTYHCSTPTPSRRSSDLTDFMLGSVCHPDPGIRRKATDHLLECVDIMDAVGSDSLKLWFADGTNYPGQDSIAGRQEDRKSTRLNSSHVKISYAVFCLKKK